ncbi:unnamed protein product [Amaranthus hypochondriacus]
MGRRGRPAKVQVVLRKPSVNSCSSREPSSSPERYLFQTSDGALMSRKDLKASSSSSRPAVGLSWVSVLKSSMKSVGVPVPQPMSGSGIPKHTPTVSDNMLLTGNTSSTQKIAKIHKNDIVDEVDEDGFRKLKKSFQKRVMDVNLSKECSLESRSVSTIAQPLDVKNSDDIGEK